MASFKIGVMANSFRLPWRKAIAKAREVGADGIQIYAVAGELSAEAMNAAARREFRRLVDDLGLEISALCGDLGGHGFQRAADNPVKIERSKRIVDLAVDVGTEVVTTHIGVIPEENSGVVYQAMFAACRELGAYAAEREVAFAIETGPESAERLRDFLDDVSSEGMAVNLDPANLVMVMGEDPVAAVYTLKDYIVHTHAKDGVQLAPCDPVAVYGAFAEGGVEGFDFGRYFNEVPLGEGAVDWPRYLRALKKVGYRGYLTVEREVGANPADDIRRAVEFLRART